MMTSTKPASLLALLCLAVLTLARGLAPALAALPKIESWQDAGGPRVLYVHAPEIPMVDIRFTFRAGSAADGDKPGIAQLTASVLTEGAGARDAAAFSDALALTGAQLGSAALRDMAWVDMRTLSDPAFFEPAMALFGDLLARPRFDAAAVAQQKSAQLVALKRSEQDPASIADERFYRALYGDHPYASPTMGTTASVDALTADDLTAFFDRYYVAENAVVAVVGDISRAEAAALVTRLVAGMRHGAAAPLPPEVALPTAPRLEAVPHDALQTHVRVGQPGMKRGDPDYFPLLVGNHALGGNSMVSELFMEIREKRGLSYSVYSVFQPMAQAGPFEAALQTGRAQTEEALTVLNETIERFVDEGPTEAALDAAKQNLIGGFPLRINTNGNMLEYLAVIGAYDLPLTYLDEFRDRVAAVDVAAVKDAFSRRVHPENFVTVVVGGGTSDPDPDVAAAGLAD